MKIYPNWFKDEFNIWHHCIIIKTKVYLDGKYIGENK